MTTLKFSSRNLKKITKKTLESIKKGGVIVCPTDTIYGLVADATNEKAVKKVLDVKERDAHKAIPVFVKDIEMAKNLANIDNRQEKFLNRVWPGEVTVVLKKKRTAKLPKEISRGKKTIGLRIPKHNLINFLLEKLDKPLTGTSANISGRPGSTKIKEVLIQLKSQKIQPDLIIDAGDLKPRKPSSVVDLTGSNPKLLRVGELSKKELFKALK